jgi:hypothetical protein
MDITRAQSAINIGPENQLRRVRQFPDANFKDVVRPNVDTLYTTAFLSMKEGPWVFNMPVQYERYELMPFMDAWTNVFASPGTRTSKSNESVYLLVGPNWQDTVPPHMTLLRSPTDIVWLIGRTQTNGVADFETVHRIQDGLQLQAFKPKDNSAQTFNGEKKSIASPPGLPPVAQIKALSTAVFFERLFQLMVDNPPAPEDAPLLKRLALEGLEPGQAVKLSTLNGIGFSVGRWLANLKIKRALSDKDKEGSWRTPPLNLGKYGTDYNTRAVVAMVGLGANLPEDAIYPNTASDQQGRALNGKHKYRIHFDAKQLPPIKAFWSITAYGADEFVLDSYKIREGKLSIFDLCGEEFDVQDDLQRLRDGGISLDDGPAVARQLVRGRLVSPAVGDPRHRDRFSPRPAGLGWAAARLRRRTADDRPHPRKARSDGSPSAGRFRHRRIDNSIDSVFFVEIGHRVPNVPRTPKSLPDDEHLRITIQKVLECGQNSRAVVQTSHA